MVAMKQIAHKIAIIDDIAYQTNLLALNAAIEADQRRIHPLLIIVTAHGSSQMGHGHGQARARQAHGRALPLSEIPSHVSSPTLSGWGGPMGPPGPAPAIKR